MAKRGEYTRRWRERNKEYIRKYNRRWTEQNRDHVNARNRRYRAEHLEFRQYLKEYNRRYARAHPELFKKYSEKYRGTHKDLIKTRNQQYRMKHANQLLLATYIFRHLEKYPLDKTCIFCGAAEKLEHAHLDYENIGLNYITACASCHRHMDKNKVELNKIVEATEQRSQQQ